MTKAVPVARAGSPEILKIVGDPSSPLSAETSFRELDDVFLQTQTRIWLGEVLHIRFDEDTAISDLLADGELLFKVSKVVWKMLLKKYAELKYSKVHIYERTSSGKSDGIYMAYPKVDSFLKICQILGLTSIDLFSPSDVVEKRDVRRVCMCIRSLSKRARLKSLNVPDFDIVTYTIAMPTNIVGGIRRTLEQSRCSSPNYSGYSSASMDPRELYRQRSPSGPPSQHYDSHSESDDTESTCAEFEFQSPVSISSYDASNPSHLVGEISPEENWVVDENISKLQTESRLDTREQNVVHGSIEPSSHEFADEFHKNSSSLRTECQIDQGARMHLGDIGEVIWPSSNHKTHEEVNNVDGHHYQSFASPYQDSSCELDEPLILPFHPLLWSVAQQNHLPKFSSSNCDMNSNNSKGLKASVDDLPQAQTVGWGPGDDGMGSECIDHYNDDNISGSQVVNEKLPSTSTVVNIEVMKENSSSITSQMVPNNLIGGVSLPGNCSDQSDIMDNICCRVDDSNGSAVPDFSLSMETVDVHQKDAENGLKRKSFNEVRVAQMYSAPSLMLSEGNHNDSSVKNFSSPKVNGLREEQPFDNILENPASTHATEAVDEVKVTNKAKDLFTTQQYGSSNESYIQDNEVYAGREVDGVDSKSLTINGREIPNYSSVYSDYHSLSCSVSDLVQNNQVLSSQVDKVCDPWNTKCKKNEQLNDPILSTTEDMTNNSLPVGESSMCIWKGEMKIGGIYEQDSFDHPYEMFKDPTVDLVNCSDKLPIEDILHLEDSNVSQMELLHVNSGKSWEQMPLPKGNNTIDTNILSSLESHQIDELDNGESNHSIDMKKVFSRVNLPDSIDSTGIDNIHFETSSKAGEPVATDNDLNSIACSSGNTGFKDEDMLIQEVLSCQPTACMMESEVCAEERIVVENQGVAPVMNDCTCTEQKETNGIPRSKGTEECEKKLAAKQDSFAKHVSRTKGNKVLKSVAGAVTLLGALFFYHHIRHKNGGKKNNEIIKAREDQTQCQESPRQKREQNQKQEFPTRKKIEAGKSDGLYPGERLKF